MALRNLEDVYPVYAPTFKSEIEFALKTKESIADLAANSKYEKQATKLYQDLDVVNADARQALVTAYSKYVTTLGSAKNADERAAAGAAFDSALVRILSLTDEVRKINAQIVAVKQNTGATEWQQLFGQTSQLSEQVKSLTIAPK